MIVIRGLFTCGLNLGIYVHSMQTAHLKLRFKGRNGGESTLNLRERTLTARLTDLATEISSLMHVELAVAHPFFLDTPGNVHALCNNYNGIELGISAP